MMVTDGKFIKSRREKLGYSQKEVAEHMDVSEHTVANYENDRSPLSIELTVALCYCLSCGLDDLRCFDKLCNIRNLRTSGRKTYRDHNILQYTLGNKLKELFERKLNDKKTISKLEDSTGAWNKILKVIKLSNFLEITLDDWIKHRNLPKPQSNLTLLSCQNILGKVLIDADFILEALLNREDLLEDAERLWNLLENQEIQGLMTDIGLKKICIFVKKLGGIEAVEQITSVIEGIVNVKIVDDYIIEKARSFDSLDFESAVEIVCAYTWKVSAILTHNICSFSEAELPILSLSQLLERQTLENKLLESKPRSLEDSVNSSLVVVNVNENNGVSNSSFHVHDEISESYNKIVPRRVKQGLLILSIIGIASAYGISANPNLVGSFFRQYVLSSSTSYNNTTGLQEKSNSQNNDYSMLLNPDNNFNDSDKILETILDNDTYKILVMSNQLLGNKGLTDFTPSSNGNIFPLAK